VAQLAHGCDELFVVLCHDFFSLIDFSANDGLQRVDDRLRRR
jgi:hypothetical protein